MTADAPSSPLPSRGPGLLGHRDVRLLLAGQAVSELGSQVGGIALPLAAADLVRGAALLTVPLAATLHRLTLAQLAVVALAVGVARVLFDVAYPSYLPTLVERERLAGPAGRRPGGRDRRRGQLPGLGRVPAGHPGR